MPEPEPLRAALLTPAGRGAVATVGVRGTQSLEVIDRLFHAASGQPLAQVPLGRVRFGRWENALSGEEVVVCRTGEREAEIHCHGGRAPPEAILASLTAQGAQTCSWQEWLRHQSTAPLETEALVALAQARTERTAGHLLAQVRGALRHELNAAREAIAAGQTSEARACLTQLADRGEFGEHLTQEWRVVLAGPPNVGKSSLFNALLGYAQALVHAEPGTTRDVLIAPAAIEGWPIELCDTAGWRNTTDPVECEGVARAQREAREADLVLWVRDLTSSETLPSPESAAGSGPRILEVWNKCDLPPAVSPAPAGLMVSAATGEGVPLLWAAINRMLVPDPPTRTAGVPFLPAQRRAIAEALAALDAQNGPAALEALARLLAVPQST